MATQTGVQWCGLRVYQTRATYLPESACGGSDDYARAVLLDLSDLTSLRPMGQPRRVELSGLWLLPLVILPWLVGVGAIAGAVLGLLAGE